MLFALLFSHDYFAGLKDAYFEECRRGHVFDLGSHANALPLFTGEKGGSDFKAFIFGGRGCRFFYEFILHHEEAKGFLPSKTDGAP